MNANVRLSTADLPALLSHFYRASVGFDAMFDRMAESVNTARETVNYPPHNIIRFSDTQYCIEVAVAGFTEQELDVSVEKNVLTISGTKNRENDTPEYMYRGISGKDFTKVLNLADHVVVRNAIYEHGLLKVNLEVVVPEELKPRKISIENANFGKIESVNLK